MPNRLPTKNPQYMAGTVLMSGDPNTGQISTTWGGTKTVSQMSGAVGPDICAWVGAGRLDTFALHAAAAVPQAASGKVITFYDSAVAVSGGPLSTSGHKIIAQLDPRRVNLRLDTFNSGALIVATEPIPVGVVFTSGLCYTTTSGNPGWTASFTPVLSGSQI